MNAPEMTPFAIATGNMRYARRVIGKDKKKNIGGGMTSRNLEVKVRLSASYVKPGEYRPVHWQIMVDPMH